MAELDPVKFSVWSLKALLKRGQRQASRKSLCEVIELLTGVGADSDVSAQYFRTVGELAEHLQRLTRKRPGRIERLNMPPDWDCEDGVYVVAAGPDGTDHGDAAIQIKNRYTEQACCKGGFRGGARSWPSGCEQTAALRRSVTRPGRADEQPGSALRPPRA